MTDENYLKKLADMQTQIKELAPDPLKEYVERRISEYIAEVVQSQYGEVKIVKEKLTRCKNCEFRDSELVCTQFDVYTSAAGDLFTPPDWFYCGYGKEKEE